MVSENALLFPVDEKKQRCNPEAVTQKKEYFF